MQPRPDGQGELVLRGDLGGRVFTALWLREGIAVAGMHANDWDAEVPLADAVSAGQG